MTENQVDLMRREYRIEPLELVEMVKRGENPIVFYCVRVEIFAPAKLLPT
jgi:hypothetical protein